MADPTPDEQARRLKEAEECFKEGIPHVTEEEVAAAAESGEMKIRRLERAIPQALKSLWADIKLLVSMLHDYVTGAYREAPFGAIAAIAMAILYLVSPFDVIPDFIPVIGYMDDAGVIALCLRMVRNDVVKYGEWKNASVSRFAEDAAVVQPDTP
jgi:uncharacterized membrane protein YkvA (DUF1232 family)